MKYLSEYRSPELVEVLLKEIKQAATKNWNIMEVCGGQTHSLAYGVGLVHGLAGSGA